MRSSDIYGSDVLDRHIKGHSLGAIDSAAAGAATDISDQDHQNDPSPSRLGGELGVSVALSHGDTIHNVLQPPTPEPSRPSDSAAGPFGNNAGIVRGTFNQEGLAPTTNDDHVQRWAMDFSTGSEQPLSLYNFSSQARPHDFLDYNDLFPLENEFAGVSRTGGLEGFLDHNITDVSSAQLIEPGRRDYGSSNSVHRTINATSSHLPGDSSIALAPRGNGDSIQGIPIARFNASKKYWLLRPLSHVSRSIEILWPDVVSMPMKNLFCDPNHPSPNGHFVQHPTSRCGLDEDHIKRLEDALNANNERYQYYSSQDDQPDRRLSELRSVDSHSTRASATSLGKSTYLRFPPPRTLEMALDLYFRHFHPLMPFIHVPTFSVQTAPPPFLFLICLIGLVVIGTPGAMTFVSQQFPVRTATSSPLQRV